MLSCNEKWCRVSWPARKAAVVVVEATNLEVNVFLRTQIEAKLTCCYYVSQRLAMLSIWLYSVHTDLLRKSMVNVSSFLNESYRFHVR